MCADLDWREECWRERTVRGLSKSHQDLHYAAFRPCKESSLCQAQHWKKWNVHVPSWKNHASKGSIVGLTPRQDWTRHFSVVPARRPGSGAQGKRNKSYSIKVPFRRYWTNQPTAGTLGLVHKVLLIILWQWESLESHGVWDRADLIMIIGLHQLQIALMEWDFSDQEHIFDCRSKFTSLSLFSASVIMQCSACVPNGQLRRDCRHEAECAFSFGVGSDA